MGLSLPTTADSLKIGGKTFRLSTTLPTNGQFLAFDTSTWTASGTSSGSFSDASLGYASITGTASGSGFVDLAQGGERNTPAAGYLRLFNNAGDLQMKTSSGNVYTMTNPVRNQFQFIQGGSLALDGYVQGQRGNFGNLSGSLYYVVDRALTINTPATEDSTASVQITAGDAAKKNLVLQLKASQTANGFELQDSSGGVLASLDAGGKLVARNFKSGTGSPEGSVVGVIGDLYTRTDGGAGTTLYCKESGTGDTGWVAK